MEVGIYNSLIKMSGTIKFTPLLAGCRYWPISCFHIYEENNRKEDPRPKMFTFVSNGASHTRAPTKI